MNESPTINEEEIVGVAAALSSGERVAYLETACRGHAEMRARIEQRLAGVKTQMPAPNMPPVSSGGIASLIPEHPGDHLGPYRLLEQIGEGGFGVVWVAEQEAPVKRRVALKIVKMGMDTKQVIARFEQERQALALMDHPNIAKVFDAGVTKSGRPFFVMELVRGVRITDYCDQWNLTADERIQLFITVCRAVQHAHVKGIVHRDLKPSNLLVSYHDGAADPTDSDFGVAKATQPQRLTDLTIYTQYEQMIGTPAYMSPEQAGMSGLDIDSRSDVYSLGALLFELLTGRPPFDPKDYSDCNLDEFRRVLREQDPKRPSTAIATMDRDERMQVSRARRIDGMSLVHLLRGDLDWVVMKAIAKDRTLRYETPNDLAADLQRYLSRRPVMARPPSTAYRFRRFVTRHKTGVISAACVLIALLTGVGVATWQAVRANNEANRAHAALTQLRAMAPSLVSEARELATLGKFNDAIQKLGYAIELQPQSIEFLRDRASLLRCEFRFAAAARDYRSILAISPNDTSARANVALCDRLADMPKETNGMLPRAALAELKERMVIESRPNAELLPVSRALGNANDIQRKVWLERLASLTNPSRVPIDQRLKMSDDGTIDLDLRNTMVSDLSALAEMPLRSLDVSGCSGIESIECLRKMRTLRKLDLTGTAIMSVEPLSECTALEELQLKDTAVNDVSPLRRLPLRTLGLARSRISDISSLRNLNLAQLEIGNTRVTNLEPIRRMPLQVLECSYTPISDYTHLAGMKIEHLSLQGARLGDLGFLRGLPLKSLMIAGARDVSNVRALAEIKSLETLILPGNPLDMTHGEVEGIEELRNHPRLRRLTCTLPQGSNPETAEPVEVFWRSWESMMRWYRPLRAAGIKFSTQRLADSTWSVTIFKQPIEDLSMFADSTVSILHVTACSKLTSLSGLKNLPLTWLGISETNISDLSPLKGMKLRELWMAATPVTDLTPLRGMPLKVIYADKCQLLSDVGPLAELRELEDVLLPWNAANVDRLQALPNLKRISYTYDQRKNQPVCSKAEFFATLHDMSWLRMLAKAKSLTFPPAQLPDGTWKLIVNDPAFSDLSILAGARISELHLNGSGISNIEPLASVPLRKLRIDNTKCIDVSPLAKIPTLECVVLPRSATDPSPLRQHLGIKKLSYDCDPFGTPQHEVKDFWKAFSPSGGQ